MIQEEREQLDQCPSAEDLSAWSDLQLKDPKIEKHVEACASCKSILKSYRNIDEEIQGNLQRATQRDMGILVRIKDESMKEIRKESPSPLGSGFILRLFASIGIIGVLLYMIFHFRSLGTSGPGTPPPPTETGGRVVDTPNITSISESDQALIELAAKREQMFADVQIIGLGVDAELLTPTLEAKELRKVEGTQNISQTWQVADPAAPAKYLKFAMPANYRKDFDQLIFQVADRGVIRLVSTEFQLQQLVDDFGSLGFKLQSAKGPQPGASATGDGKVVYQVEFQRQD